MFCAIVPISRQDTIDRNPIEGEFGQSKRHLGLGLVMTKLSLTSQCVIAMTFLVVNLENLLKFQFLYFIFIKKQHIMYYKYMAKRLTINHTVISYG